MLVQFIYPRLPQLSRATINFSGSGDNTVLPASTAGRNVIYRLWLVCGGATSLTFKDNLVSPAAVPMAANGGITFDITGEPWFATDINTAFIINSSGGVQISGCVSYLVLL